MTTNNDDLSVRIKNYEKSYEHKIPHDEFVIVRIDGHKFSKFTKHFYKPYDNILSMSMENTTKDLVKRFGAVAGYTQSDEITLVFPPQFKEKDETLINNQVFAGRTQKMSSLIASYASIRFNYWLQDEYASYLINFEDEPSRDKHYEENVEDSIGEAYFDARVFGVPSKEEAFNTIFWRWKDALRNSKSMFAQAYCSHKSLLNKTSNKQVQYCKEQTGNDWDDISDKYKFGTFVKKESYLKDTDEGTIERTRVTSFTISNLFFSEENVDLIIRKLL